MRQILKEKLQLLAGILVIMIIICFCIPLFKFAIKIQAFRSSHIEIYDPGKRILVIAPHPDDETLATAGIIQRALMKEDSVKIVVVTSGDHFIKAARLLTGKKYLKPSDYAYLGRVREKECLEALKVLGVSGKDIIFLHYHDRSINSMLKRFDENNYQRNDYGEKLEMLLKNMIVTYHPTDIYYPYIKDEHPDHKGVSDFVNRAINLSHQRTRKHLYMVHYEGNRWPYFPLLYRFMPLIPPYDLINRGIVWEVFKLRPEEVQKKEIAVRQYKSQMSATGGRYLIFVRPDEIFVSPWM